ncbi:tripartite tricarboxylate transporter TctB family protein [Paracoccus sp. JM45]|uniref:tripartite tricarboxylate transporter TctB family protein n=1 Tax=Paracoccus sp. JM45 TaxID=2283626 RepID=UPI000E6CD759|nr:tripartite tricarboxylate transporter TctB family protein [Paracoccus sp. JM45]RJE79658.1 tripartite tricarboxylate transporter TctB family protein [Paracoccus sp. JM45]
MQRDYYDLIWGGILALLGLGVAAYAVAHYDFGSLRRMGPGFFPVLLGIGLAGLGTIIAVPAFGRTTEARAFAWPETIGVIGSLLLFGLLLNRLGLMGSTAITVLVASSVAPRKGILWRLVLTVVVTALVWVLFVLGLDMSIPVWPQGY